VSEAGGDVPMFIGLCFRESVQVDATWPSTVCEL